MAVGVGDQAPDFTTDGVLDGAVRPYSLTEYRGQPVVLIFYPGDNTPVCTRQLNTYTQDVEDFSGVDAQILALSPQDIESHEGFATAQGGFAFPLLDDSAKAIAKAYGVLGPVGYYRRSSFVIGPDGVIVYAHRSVAGLNFTSTDALVAAVKSISA